MAQMASGGPVTIRRRAPDRSRRRDRRGARRSIASSRGAGPSSRPPTCRGAARWRSAASTPPAARSQLMLAGIGPGGGGVPAHALARRHPEAADRSGLGRVLRDSRGRRAGVRRARPSDPAARPPAAAPRRGLKPERRAQTPSARRSASMRGRPALTMRCCARSTGYSTRCQRTSFALRVVGHVGGARVAVARLPDRARVDQVARARLDLDRPALPRAAAPPSSRARAARTATARGCGRRRSGRPAKRVKISQASNIEKT